MFSKKIKARISIILCSLMILSIIGALNLFSKIEDGYKKQLIKEIESLMTEANNVGAEFNCELDLEAQSVKDLTDIGFLLKFGIESQKKVNTQKLEMRQLAHKSTPSEKYIAEEAYKIYEGNTILNIDGFNLSFTYGIDINIRYSFVRNIDEYGLYTQKMYKVLDVNSNINNDNINEENFIIKNFEQKNWHISEMTDSYAQICGAAKCTLETPEQDIIACAVPFSAKLDFGEGLFLYESDSPIEN